MKSLKCYFSEFDYANNTTCVQSTNLKLIQQNLITIFENENYRLISQPPLPQDSDFLTQELLYSPYKTTPYLWAIGLSASTSGWTTIKTSVENLLCRKVLNNQQRWLSKIAVSIGCNVFHHAVQKNHWGVLIEANALGETLTTGTPLEIEDPDDIRFYNIPVSKLKNTQNFSLLNVPEIFQEAGIKRILSQKEKQIKNENLERLFRQGEKEINEALAEWKEINKGGRECLDKDLGNLICKPYSFWEEENILYKSYYEASKLEQNKIELMFFQVGRLDLDPTTEDIWSPIKNFNWIDYSVDFKKVNLARQ